MLALGVSLPRVYQEVFERNSAALVRLGGIAHSSLQLLEGGRLACITMTHEQILSCGAEQEDTSEIVNGLLAIDGVRLAVMFKEVAEGRVKLSFRSKGDLDVNRLAALFGGGGHRNAAGAVIEGPLDAAMTRVLGSCRGLLRQTA